MSIRLDEPWWLLLALGLIPMSWWAWRSFSAMSVWRRASAVLFRAALMLLLLTLLAGASMVKTSDRVSVVAVVDVSGSVKTFAPPLPVPPDPADAGPPSVLASVQRYLELATNARGPEDLLGVVVFDGQSIALATPTAGPALDRPLDVSMAEGSDLAGAIRLATAIGAPDAAHRILVFSDGVSTGQDPVEAATRQSGRGGSGAAPTPIDVIPFDYRVENEVLIESLDVPSNAPAGAVVTARITLFATAPATGTLRLLREDEELDANGSEPGLGRRVTLNAGRITELINVPLTAGRVHRLRASFEPDLVDGRATGDSLAVNNTAEAVTVTPGKGSVLILDGVDRGRIGGPGEQLARTLRQEGLDVDCLAPEGLPTDLLRLQAYDLVILQNVPAEQLGEAGQERLSRFVSDLGGGLVMVGGPDSFGAGGYLGSMLGAILPVKLDLPDRLMKPAAAVLLVIDNSGSMDRSVAGSIRTQQDIANEGAAAAIRSLDRGDLVGIITFNSDYDVLVPLGPNSDAKKSIEAVRGISAGGGTNMPPALEEARRQLKAVDAKIKHLIVLSDGLSENNRRLPDIAKGLAEDGVQVSSIALGDAADADGLARLAEIGGGTYYRVTDPTILPRVFVRAVRVVRTPMIRESPFVPILIDQSSPLASGLSGAIPPLGGLVLTQPRPEPTINNVLVTSEGEPVLAHWPVGLGQVAAFTSDAHRWGAEWIDWPGYRRMWSQLARAIARPTGQRQAELSTEIVGDTLRIRMDASDDQSQPIDGLAAPASVYTPDGRRQDVRLSQVGPGQYEALVAAPQAGSYVVTVSPKLGAKALSPVIGGAAQARGVEFRRLAADPEALKRLAAATGGRVLDPARPQDARLYDRSTLTRQEARLPLWPLLLVAALVVALLDIATRRIAWDRAFSAEFGRSLRDEAARSLRDRGVQASKALAALRRIDRPAPNASKALGDADADELAQQARQRRRAGVASTANAPALPPDDDAAAKAAAAQPGSAEPEGGLLAAKRRARERFGQE